MEKDRREALSAVPDQKVVLNKTQISDKSKLLGLELPQRIIKTLAEYDTEARFCGGVVRDIITGQLKWPMPDIDMASPMSPKKASDVLKKAGLKVIPTGIDHGTITVMLSSEPDIKVELTTLRVDINPDGRHSDVDFIEDWQADAARRDFTFNSLYMTAEGVIFDPFNGIADLNSGVVRFIGNPQDRLREDVLRVFRYFRFFARFGQQPIDDVTSNAITAALDQIGTLSGERISSELRKITQYRSLQTIKLMDALGVWRALIGDKVKIDDYSDLLGLKIEHDHYDLLSLAVLIPEHRCEQLASRLKFSRKDTLSLLRMAKGLKSDQLAVLLSNDYKQECWRLCHRHGWAIHEVVGVTISSAINGGDQMIETIDDFNDQIRLIQYSEWPAMPVNGDDIRAYGISEGKHIGNLLTQIEDFWVAENFAPNRRTLLTLLADRIEK